MTGLLEELQRIIADEGPISVERYMTLCLSHPVHGYYATRDPFGVAGDFTTAPEISQIFGELLGLWALELWNLMGSPKPLQLVELGPGRGTLMDDVLRVARIRPAFVEALSVHLVETSPTLRRRQQGRLQRTSVAVNWHERLAAVPEGPTILIANEFFDALPIRQLVRSERGWCERLVGVGQHGELVFGLAPEAERSLTIPGRLGEVIELPRAGMGLMEEIADRLTRYGGAALIIDYGFDGPACGDTLQAVQAHLYADPLSKPGASDLTAHVDFAKLAGVARRHGLAVSGPVSQRNFLRSLGLEERARALRLRANADQARQIDSALERLAGSGRESMGELFKAMAVANRTLPQLPGFGVAVHETQKAAS